MEEPKKWPRIKAIEVDGVYKIIQEEYAGQFEEEKIIHYNGRLYQAVEIKSSPEQINRLLEQWLTTPK